MELFYRRSFPQAAEKFKEACRHLPNDFNAQNILRRCEEYASNPPPADWHGVEVMKTK
jgi:hypothetical protein